VVLTVSLADAAVMLCKADISCLYMNAIHSSLDTVPSPFVSNGSVDDEDDDVDDDDDDVDDVLLDDVELAEVVPSVLLMSGGGPMFALALSKKDDSSDCVTDPSPSVSMAVKRSSRDDALSVEDVLVDEELLDAALLAAFNSLFEMAPSPSVSRSLNIFVAICSAIFLRISVRSTELVELLILETDMGSSLDRMGYKSTGSSTLDVARTPVTAIVVPSKRQKPSSRKRRYHWEKCDRFRRWC
jgi:hypothetical protein